MRPDPVAPNGKSGAEPSAPTGPSGGAETLSKSAQATRRSNSRGLVHPAYAPLGGPEAHSSDASRASEEPALQVLVRTRDSGRVSPCIATPTRRSPLTTWPLQKKGSVSPLYCSPEHPPSYEFQATANLSCSKSDQLQKEPLPPTVVHQSLYGRCPFISFPVLAPFEPTPPPTNSFPLFIGQVRFETTPAELLWLFRRTSGARAATVETRGTGCFIVHLKSESERSLVRQLHKRVLFDVGGVWFARAPEEVDSLCEYVTIEGPYLSKQAKLPRDSMVVEYMKGDSSDAAPNYPFYYNDKYAGGVGRRSTSSKTSTPTRAQYPSNSSLFSMAPMPPSYRQLYGSFAGTLHTLGDTH